MESDDETQYFIEIGARYNPTIQDLPDYYVPKTSKVLFVDNKSYSGSPNYSIRADAESLPFSDNSIHLVYLRNVLGAHGTHPQGPDGNYLTGQKEKIDADKIAEELKRVLEPGGRAIFVECSATTSLSAPSDKIKEIFAAQGFMVDETYEGDSIINLYDPSTHPDNIGQILGKVSENEWLANEVGKNYPEASYAIVFRKNQY